MSLFNIYRKIFKRKMLVIMLLYLVLFGMISVVNIKSHNESTNTEFHIKKIDALYIDNDNSNLSKHLKKVVERNTNIVTLKDNETLEDKMFYRAAKYACTVPKNFEKDILNGDNVNVETTVIPDSMYSVSINMDINKYLSSVKFYMNSEKCSLDEAMEKADKILDIKSNIATKNKDADSISHSSQYFNALAYVIICVLILSICQLSFSFNDIEVRRRNYISPTPITKYTGQLLVCHIIVSALVFLTYYILGIIECKDVMFTAQGQVMIINMAILTITMTSLSFMLSQFATKESVSALSNTISLACCFLGGAFVPQSVLSKSVKNVGMFNPVYWYVKTNDTVSSLSVVNATTLKPVIFNMLIVLAFAVVFMCITLVIIKNRRTAEK